MILINQHDHTHYWWHRVYLFPYFAVHWIVCITHNGRAMHISIPNFLKVIWPFQVLPLSQLSQWNIIYWSGTDTVLLSDNIMNLLGWWNSLLTYLGTCIKLDSLYSSSLDGISHYSDIHSSAVIVELAGNPIKQHRMRQACVAIWPVSKSSIMGFYGENHMPCFAKLHGITHQYWAIWQCFWKWGLIKRMTLFRHFQKYFHGRKYMQCYWWILSR